MLNKKLRQEKQKNRIIKKLRKEKIKKPRNKYAHWVCTKCGNTIDILMSPRYIELYTEERKNNFVCLNCRD